MASGISSNVFSESQFRTQCGQWKKAVIEITDSSGNIVTGVLKTIYEDTLRLPQFLYHIDRLRPEPNMQNFSAHQDIIPAERIKRIRFLAQSTNSWHIDYSRASQILLDQSQKFPYNIKAVENILKGAQPTQQRRLSPSKPNFSTDPMTEKSFRRDAANHLGHVVEVTDKRNRIITGIFYTVLLDTFHHSTPLYLFGRFFMNMNQIEKSFHYLPATCIETIQALGENFRDWKSRYPDSNRTLQQQLKAYPLDDDLTADIIDGTFQCLKSFSSFPTSYTEESFRKIARNYFKSVVEVTDTQGRSYVGVLDSTYLTNRAGFKGYYISRLGILDGEVVKDHLHMAPADTIDRISVLAIDLKSWLQSNPAALQTIADHLKSYPLDREALKKHKRQFVHFDLAGFRKGSFQISPIDETVLGLPYDQGPIDEPSFRLQAQHHVGSILEIVDYRGRVYTGILELLPYMNGETAFYPITRLRSFEKQLKPDHLHTAPSSSIHTIRFVAPSLNHWVQSNPNAFLIVQQHLSNYPKDPLLTKL